MSDTSWHQDAVIDHLHVRTFADSNGDGIGDFRRRLRPISSSHPTNGAGGPCPYVGRGFLGRRSAQREGGSPGKGRRAVRPGLQPRPRLNQRQRADRGAPFYMVRMETLVDFLTVSVKRRVLTCSTGIRDTVQLLLPLAA